jgi:hypothetical protein
MDGQLLLMIKSRNEAEVFYFYLFDSSQCFWNLSVFSWLNCSFSNWNQRWNVCWLTWSKCCLSDPWLLQLQLQQFKQQQIKAPQNHFVGFQFCLIGWKDHLHVIQTFLFWLQINSILSMKLSPIWDNTLVKMHTCVLSWSAMVFWILLIKKKLWHPQRNICATKCKMLWQWQLNSCLWRSYKTWFFRIGPRMQVADIHRAWWT